MKRNVLLTIGIAIITVLCITGCKKSDDIVAPGNNTSLSQSDQQALNNIRYSDPLLSASGDEATLDDGTASSSPSLAKVDTAITPIAWGRHFTNDTSNVTYDKTDDSTVIATITNTLTGILWIRPITGSDITKSIVVNTLRTVRFEKVTKNDSVSWWVRSISPVQGKTTSSSSTISIQEVKFFIGASDADSIDVVAPPYLDYLTMGGLDQTGGKIIHYMSANPNRVLTVQATVVSSSPDSDVVVVHHPDISQNIIIRERMRLISSTLNNDGTYTRVYKHSWIGDYAGRHTIHVTAFTRSSIYDNVAPVTSEGWGIPYIVK